MAPPRIEPASVVVAHAAVEGGVRMEPEAPPTLRLRTGQPLRLKFTYRLRDATPAKEEYRFELVSRLGNERAGPAVAHWGDTWGYPEDVAGFLHQEYVTHRAGTYDLVWQAVAEYSARGWAEAGPASDIQRAARKGLIRVTVDDDGAVRTA